MATTRSDPVQDHPSGALRRELKFWETIALSIAIMAPTAAMALNGTAPAGLIGRAVPLAFIFAHDRGAARLIGVHPAVSAHFSHAGSVYAFSGVTLGPRAGFFAGWALLGTYMAFLRRVDRGGRDVRDRLLPGGRHHPQHRLCGDRAGGRRADRGARLRRHPDRDEIAAGDGGHLGDADRDRDDRDRRQADRRHRAGPPVDHGRRVQAAAGDDVLGRGQRVGVRVPVVWGLRGRGRPGRGIR